MRCFIPSVRIEDTESERRRVRARVFEGFIPSVRIEDTERRSRRPRTVSSIVSSPRSALRTLKVISYILTEFDRLFHPLGPH